MPFELYLYTGRDGSAAGELYDESGGPVVLGGADALELRAGPEGGPAYLVVGQDVTAAGSLLTVTDLGSAPDALAVPPTAGRPAAYNLAIGAADVAVLPVGSLVDAEIVHTPLGGGPRTADRGAVYVMAGVG